MESEDVKGNPTRNISMTAESLNDYNINTLNNNNDDIFCGIENDIMSLRDKFTNVKRKLENSHFQTPIHMNNSLNKNNNNNNNGSINMNVNNDDNLSPLGQCVSKRLSDLKIKLKKLENDNIELINPQTYIKNKYYKTYNSSNRKNSNTHVQNIINKAEMKGQSIFAVSNDKSSCNSNNVNNNRIKSDMDDDTLIFNNKLDSIWNKTELHFKKINKLNENFSNKHNIRSYIDMKHNATMNTTEWSLNDNDNNIESPIKNHNKSNPKRISRAIQVNTTTNHVLSMETPMNTNINEPEWSKSFQKIDFDDDNSVYTEQNRKKFINDIKNLSNNSLRNKVKCSFNKHGYNTWNGNNNNTFNSNDDSNQKMLHLQQKIKKYEQRLRNINPNLLD